MRFGAGGGAERGYEGAVEVMCEIECGEDEWRIDAEDGAGQGW